MTAPFRALALVLLASTLAATLALPAAGAREPLTALPDVDADQDGYADEFELEICGREFSRVLVASPDFPGECVSSRDYVGPAPDELAVGAVLGAPGWAEWELRWILFFNDDDADGIPNTEEDTFCYVESDASQVDGTCADGENYYKPVWPL